MASEYDLHVEDGAEVEIVNNIRGGVVISEDAVGVCLAFNLHVFVLDVGLAEQFRDMLTQQIESAKERKRGGH